ncbi:hypothetical protein B0H15DRAFT_797028 [Mycena belliarum]|uniref:Uncharacterized protein n=1 Tax=Mycena belliarum TaxID=1033014 RepID=A0AAD6UHT3_9AGAR|nr:hypothetical protein B0H15DRAFT_797028 [Mycena belliae]
MDTERLEIMDSQRFDVSKRRNMASSLNLSIQTGLSHGSDDTVPIETNPLLPSPTGSWDSSFARDSSPDASDSASDSHASTPPTSLTSSITLEDDANPKTVHQTDVFDKGPFTTTRTIIRPMPRSPLLACFSRPSSPVNVISRPSSPINFAALNCFAGPDAFTEEVNKLQAQRARELEGNSTIQVAVRKMVSTEFDAAFGVTQPEVLRRRAMEPRGIVSSP